MGRQQEAIMAQMERLQHAPPAAGGPPSVVSGGSGGLGARAARAERRAHGTQRAARGDDELDDDRRSIASTSAGRASHLADLLGHPDPTLQYTADKTHFSPEWAAALRGTNSNVPVRAIPDLNATLCLGRANMDMAAAIEELVDNPGPEARARAEQVLIANEQAEAVALQRLNMFQLLADGQPAAAASAIIDAAAFAQRSESEAGPVMAGLPIACPHMRELVDAFKKKAIDKAVKEIHEQPSAKGGGKGKGDKSKDDDDDLQKALKQLEQERARAKKLESRLQQAGQRKSGDGAKRDDKSKGGGGGGAKKDDKKKKDDAPPGGADP